jgi:hypothetical protein
MENSGKIFFEEDDTPCWYVALGTRWLGPMTASDIYEKILNHKLTWAHYVWRPGQKEWNRVCDVEAFQSAVPHQPDKSVQKAVQEVVRSVKGAGRSVSKASSHLKSSAKNSVKKPVKKLRNGDLKTWYLYYNQSQFGPFSQEEIERFIQIGKIHGRVYGWCKGMRNWVYLEQIEALKRQFPATQFSNAGPKSDVSEFEQRQAPRRPLVAKILMTNEQSVIVGVCRDISVGGLQVLSQKVPGKVGTKLKMNISPSTNKAGEMIEPFVADGVIARILEDGRGFSFRFEQLSDRARKAIESYIESSL